jgi:protein-L-isoaspartate(D-aspartate) O-methyltransferase
MADYFQFYPENADEMVAEQIAPRGIKDQAVLAAMRKVPRHLFVPEKQRHLAYTDQPLPIGFGQTISQPYVVAFMTAALQLDNNARVLEIGTGSGYQTAVLAEIAQEVYTVEVIASLSMRAQEICRQLGYRNIYFKIDNGRQGWASHAPYSHIIVTAASSDVPPQLLEQLAEKGKMIIPIGSLSWGQDLVLIKKHKNRLTEEKILPVRFVPLIKSSRNNQA